MTKQSSKGYKLHTGAIFQVEKAIVVKVRDLQPGDVYRYSWSEDGDDLYKVYGHDAHDKDSKLVDVLVVDVIASQTDALRNKRHYIDIENTTIGNEEVELVGKYDANWELQPIR